MTIPFLQCTQADPPRVTRQPQGSKDAVPGNAVMFTVEATGTDPLRYQWEWKPAGERNEWQPVELSGSDQFTLTIPSVQKSNEGSYHCVISNYAGTLISNPVQLSVADPPKVTFHPQELKNVVPGQPAMFTVVATGTESLIYQWEWQPAENEEWQLCDTQGSDSATLIIPSAQKSNEGSYRCIIRNYAGGQASNPANLSVDTKPTLQELLKFTCTDRRVINIPVELGTDYFEFGTFLLDDKNGSKVKIIVHEHQKNAKEINTEILQEWLTGKGKKPVTWATIVEVMHDIKHFTLARDIEAVKCPAKPVFRGSV